MNRHTPGLNAIAARYPTPTSSEDHARAKGDTQASKCLGALAKVGPSAQLNPDWVEWLMGWPVGWTDITRDECDWRDISVKPDDIHIATTRRDNRAKRIKAIGNGQVPLCAAVAAEYGFAFLEAVHAHTSSPSGTTPEAGGLFPSGSSSPPRGVFHPPVFSPAPSRNDGKPQTQP